MIVNVGKLHQELAEAGLPVESVAALPGKPDEPTVLERVYYTRELTRGEQGQATAIIAAHDPADREKERKEAARAELRALDTSRVTVAELARLVKDIL